MSLCKKQTRRSEQVFDAVNGFFGEEHCRIVTFVDDTAGDQDGSQFDLNAVTEEYEQAKYLVWISTDILTGAPTPSAGVTLVAVEYDADDEASVIAGKVKAALDALDPALFKSEVEDDTLHVRNKFLGVIDDESFADAGDITMEVGVIGFGGSLGAFAEGVTMSTEIASEVITSDQSGDTPLDEVIRGVNISLSMSIAEMTKERWLSLVGKVSGDFVEIGQETIVGFGESKLFNSKLDFAGKLVLHPVRLPLSDRSSDYVLHLTTPNMDEINFSGSERQAASFSFTAYASPNIDRKVNIFSRGDYTLL
jgi:hypothetical protein